MIRCINSNDVSKIVSDEKRIFGDSLGEGTLLSGIGSDMYHFFVDEEKDYCPQNCEWISSKENSRYKSTTNSITVGGVTHSGREWADILNIGTNTINTYIRDYGEEKTKQLIDNMLNFEPRDRKHGETWFETYGVS